MTGFSSGTAAHHSYDPGYFVRLFDIEDRHFWFRTRNQVISILVSQIIPTLAPEYRVLEVGCGTGNVLRILEQTCLDGMVIGMDLFAEGLQYAHQRISCPLVQGDMHSPPFGTKQFDLIGLFDVLEHLPDDMRVLNELHAMLALGGRLLLTVPAHSSLWSYFDEASHHCRRYGLADLRNKLSCTGYRIEYLTPYMTSIYPLVWLGRRAAELFDQRPSDDTGRTNELTVNELRIVPIINTILTFLLTQETRLIAHRRRLPIGTSLLAIARKEH